MMYQSLLSILFVSIFLVGCESSSNNAVAAPTLPPSVSGDIVDSVAWYDDANDDLLTVRVSILTPNALLCSPYTDVTAPQRPCLLDDVNNDLNPKDDYEPVLKVAMYSDPFIHADGPDGINGFNNTNNPTVNAELKLRGNLSRSKTPKSYAVKLDSKTDLFLDQRKFQFIKHRPDSTRVRNKLAFDLFRDIPNFPSLKLQFVKLLINGDTSNGIYTHAEAIRKEYLVNRGWNEDDNLYSAEEFFFQTHENLALDKDGKPLNEDAFEDILEIKNGKDHRKLVEMLNALASTSDIDSVIEKYFNRDNYVTWLAVNLILSNKDTTFHNYFLYNPLNSDTFYFLPWDYDGAWAVARNLSKNEYGIEVWWETTLHKKFFRIEKNRNEVYEKVAYLRKNFITDNKILNKLELYEPVMIQEKGADWMEVAEALAIATKYDPDMGIANNIALYESVIGHPMPFRQRFTYTGTTLNLSWDFSEDFEGDEIVYDISLANEPSFVGTPIFEATGITETFIDIPNIDPGIYYTKITSREVNDASHYQVSLSQFYDETAPDGEGGFGVNYYGVQDINLTN